MLFIAFLALKVNLQRKENSIVVAAENGNVNNLGTVSKGAVAGEGKYEALIVHFRRKEF